MEYLFRAWDKNQNKMVTVSAIDWGNQCVDFDDGVGIVSLQMEEVILMQFTGRFDKNKKMIFEKDLVQETYVGERIWEDTKNPATVLQNAVGEVYYAEIPTFDIKLIKKGIYRCDNGNVFENLHMNHYDGLYMWTTDVELDIIGNTLENPNLLKEVE